MLEAPNADSFAVNVSANPETAAECGILFCCLATITCCGGPVAYWYFSLPEDEQLQIECATSLVIGIYDNIFDYIVAIRWLSRNQWWWGLGILFAIVLSGSIPFYAVLFDDWHIGLSKSERGGLAIAYLFGFGVYYDAYQTYLNPTEHHDKFELVRLFEVSLESIPSGAIQLYATCITTELEGADYSWVEFASLLGSVLSIAYGIVVYWDREGTKFLSVDFAMSDRYQNANWLFQPLLGGFVATDFVFRVSSMAYFIVAFDRVRRWLAVAIWLPGVILCLGVSACASDTKSNNLIAFLMSGVTIISSLGLFIIVIDKRAGFKFWAYEWCIRFLVNFGFCASAFYYRDSETWLNICLGSGVGNALIASWLYCLVGERFFNVV